VTVAEAGAGPIPGTPVTPAPRREGWGNTVAGGVLVGLVVLAALWFRHHPGPVFVDRWGFSLVHPDPRNTTWIRVTDLRSLPVLVAGSVLAAVVVLARDRLRAVACLVAPALAVALTEYVVKPAIARRYSEVLTFPSGSTTAVGALATAWVLAVPRRLRLVVAAVAAFLVGLECIAVVALQWHFPTDALGGAVVGAGVVLLVDGLLHLTVGGAVGHAPGGGDRRPPASAPPGPA
jgi:hypothetical protein